MADEYEPDLGPIKGQRKKAGGHTLRHCRYCNNTVEVGEYILYEIDQDGESDQQVSHVQSLNKNKNWELLEHEDVEVAHNPSRRHGVRKTKAAGSKEWKGIGDSETHDGKDMSQQGRQAKKLARQQKAKNAKSVEHRTTGGKVTVTKAEPEEESSSSTEESWSESGSEEEKGPAYRMQLETKLASKADRSRAVCLQCRDGYFGRDWRNGPEKQRKIAKDSWKDQL